MYYILTRPTARDLTLEAARDAGAARRPTRPLQAAQIKKLLDSRSQADVLDGLRRVVSVCNASPNQRTHSDIFRCNTTLHFTSHFRSSLRSSRHSRIRLLRLALWYTPTLYIMPKLIQTPHCCPSTRFKSPSLIRTPESVQWR